MCVTYNTRGACLCVVILGTLGRNFPVPVTALALGTHETGTQLRCFG